MAVRSPANPRTAGPRPIARVSLDDEVQYVKGVGPSAARMLAKMGIHTAGDLLRHMPRRYEDRTAFRRIREIAHGEWATVSGRVLSAQNQPTSRRNFTITRVLIDDGSGVAQIVYFNQPYLQKLFEDLALRNGSLIVYGQAKRSGYGPIEIERAEWEELDPDGDPLSANRIVPVYPATEGINQRRLRRMVDSVLTTHLACITEPLPNSVRHAHKLMEVQSAVRAAHFPPDFATLDMARRRLIFEEFFVLQVGLARRRAARSRESHGLEFTVDNQWLREQMHAILPFELTAAQQRAIREIEADVSGGHVMNRLVQGDVGSGKTVVALAAMLLAVRNGFQAALMAPTEILAQQHAIVLRHLLDPLGIGVELATGSQRAKAKTAAQMNIQSGQSPIAVGTHALIQEDFNFRRLGLAVIDEQHRFGVLQRQALHKKGESPHILVMTATPIPRTLTMTLYGDLDTSVINELPPGRKPIKTHWKRRTEAGSVYASMQRLLLEGRQAYVVCPLVAESEKLQVKAATQLAEHIATEVLPTFRIGLLHGQMKSDEKDSVMGRFKAGELDVLVSTTVIEVGIDVANASVIVIEDADRFGLAQLHQLRGRVGRGQHASFCVLLADAKTDDARARMQVMVDTTDGFRIAEEDLKLRGPGEFFGTRQSGLPEFYIADLLRDQQVLAETREAAFALVEADPNLNRPEHLALRNTVEQSRAGFDLARVS